MGLHEKKVSAQQRRAPAEGADSLHTGQRQSLPASSDKRLISRTCEQLQNLDMPKPPSISTWTEKTMGWGEGVLKGDAQVVSEYSRKQVTALSAREMQIRATFRSCLIPGRLTFIQKLTAKRQERNTSSPKWPCAFTRRININTDHPPC